MDIAELGRTIRAARQSAGLTQAGLGDFVGADRFTIAALEQGNATTQVKRLFDVLSAVGLEIEIRARTTRLASRDADADADADADVKL